MATGDPFYCLEHKESTALGGCPKCRPDTVTLPRAVVEEMSEALTLAKRAQPRTLAMVTERGFVFGDVPPVSDTGPHRWQSLAFTLYTDIAEVSQAAEAASEALKEALGEKP